MTSGGHGSTRDSFNALKPTTRSKTARTLFRKKKKKSYLTAKALCLQLPPPFPRCFRYNTVSFLCLTTAYCVAHREYHFNCVVLSNRLFVAIEKRFCSRPVILRHAISIHFLLSSYSFLFFFFLYRKEITFRDEFIHESRDIEDIFFPFFFVPSRKRKNEEKPSLKNSENLEIKPYKKKKLHFLYYFRRCSNAKKTSGWNREKRVVGRFLLYTVWTV